MTHGKSEFPVVHLKAKFSSFIFLFVDDCFGIQWHFCVDIVWSWKCKSVALIGKFGIHAHSSSLSLTYTHTYTNTHTHTHYLIFFIATTSEYYDLFVEVTNGFLFVMVFFSSDVHVRGQIAVFLFHYHLTSDMAIQICQTILWFCFLKLFSEYKIAIVRR